jgi:SAM-dependent methyltransferase
MHPQATDTELYGSGFFDEIESSSIASAEVIVPLVMKLVEPQSVLDVGCGRGAWLKVLERAGARDIAGVDGPHVNRDQLLIRPSQFAAIDLRNPSPLTRKFDLAVCLEVAEHLPASAALQLVSMLVAAAPVILFSAAVPGQGGTAHINEQWPEYWRKLFAERGYSLLDPIRPAVLLDRRVAWWYRQNVVMYCSAAALASHPSLKRHICEEDDPGIEWLHQYAVQNTLQELRRKTLEGTPAKGLAKAFWRRLWRRIF